MKDEQLMRRLRSNSRKNRIYQAFREVGKGGSVRTVALLRYLADPALRARISRFGSYATDELRHRQDPFDLLLKEVDFTDVELAA